MAGSLGLVIPAYRADPGVLADYITALDTQLSPTAIRIELDAPDPGVRDRLTDCPATINVSERRRGKGAALTAGFEALTTDILAFADADGSTPVESLADVIAPISDDTADLSVGSRRHPDATVRSHQTYARRWLGHVFARVARRVLNVSLYDYQCGAKAITRDAWRAVRTHLYEPGFAWDIELIAMTAALGYRVTEVPIIWDDRPGSTVSTIRTSIALARALLHARHRAKLIADNHLHAALESYRRNRPPLVDQPGWNDD